MDENRYYITHHSGKVVIDAVIYAGSFKTKSGRKSSPSPELSPIRRRSISPENRKGEFDVFPCERFEGNGIDYTEIAEKNAQELIKEEEAAKMKAEKKRAKKERQKQKKKEINKSNSPVKDNTNNDSSINKISNAKKDNLLFISDSKDAEGLDIHAAFLSQAVKKAKDSIVNQEESKPKKEVKDINLLIKMALKYEKNENFKDTIYYLSEAINLAPKRYDLILKRSLIYYEAAKFEKSIRDAKKVLQHSPKNAAGYYRLAEAQFAINNLIEAEAGFNKLLSLNSYVDQAKKRLFSIHIKQLEEMGYNHNEAFTALINSKNKTLNEAIDYLTTLEVKENSTDLYYSDDEDDEDESEEEYSVSEENVEGAKELLVPSTTAVPETSITVDKKSPLLKDPTNPLGCKSLFVGNLKNDITYQELNNVFIKFGEIISIKLRSEPSYYAFVNYADSSAAGNAMEALQGSRWLLSTIPLLIKFPTKIASSAISTLKNPECVMNKLKFPTPTNAHIFKATTTLAGQPVYQTDKNLPVFKSVTTLSNQPVNDTDQNLPVTKKPRPPPQTEECFYWRTTGCLYGNRCFNLHIPDHKGINLRGKNSFVSQSHL